MKRFVHFLTGKDAQVAPNGGQGYFPSDIQRAYSFPSKWLGEGQTIGILEFSSGYSLPDAKAFWSMHGITAPNVTFVSVDGTRNDGGQSQNDVEASLDLQWAGALAPRAHFVVYEANGGQTFAEFAAALVRTLDYILSDTTHSPSVLSLSYGDAEASFTTAELQAIAARIQALDAKGVTVCIASGDQGAYGMHNLNGPRIRHADAPATSPYAVAVGGTHLFADGAERAWTYFGRQNAGATGGGFSAIFYAPSWQQVTGHSMRGVPDVAFNADPASGYQIVFQGSTVVVGGTSVSCPVFAAMVALANEARASAGKAPLTGLVQKLYQHMKRTPYRDITRGNNSFNGVIGYQAVPGWDAATGFGSVNVDAFVNAMVALA